MPGIEHGQRSRYRPLPAKGYTVNQGLTIKDLAGPLGYVREHLVRASNRQEALTRDLAIAVASELSLGLEEAALLLGPPTTWTPGRQRMSPNPVTGSPAGARQ